MADDKWWLVTMVNLSHIDFDKNSQV